MQKLLPMLFACCILPLSSFSAAPENDDAADMVEKKTALVQVLDKASGKTRQLKLSVGQTSQFEKLVIDTKVCLAAAEYSPEDYSAFFQINKAGAASEPVRIFSGWMLQSSPGANPLEDENYDLWLVKCI
ncbi:MAG: DUF2155 domain-containing protein [Rickettsiales bacterium]|jgi:hypothetical protein|nr:DUF2155 domain-containing protein [Rickettsiales bacterium]